MREAQIDKIFSVDCRDSYAIKCIEGRKLEHYYIVDSYEKAAKLAEDWEQEDASRKADSDQDKQPRGV